MIGTVTIVILSLLLVNQFVASRRRIDDVAPSLRCAPQHLQRLTTNGLA
jgi:hypothetical protein